MPTYILVVHRIHIDVLALKLFHTMWMFLLFIFPLDALAAPIWSEIRNRANVEPFVLPPPSDGPGAMDSKIQIVSLYGDLVFFHLRAYL